MRTFTISLPTPSVPAPKKATRKALTRGLDRIALIDSFLCKGMSIEEASKKADRYEKIAAFEASKALQMKLASMVDIPEALREPLITLVKEMKEDGKTQSNVASALRISYPESSAILASVRDFEKTGTFKTYPAIIEKITPILL